MKGSLIVVGFFILGVLAGRSGGLPTWAMDSSISFVALCGLLLFVGLGIGMNPDMKNDIKSQPSSGAIARSHHLRFMARSNGGIYNNV